MSNQAFWKNRRVLVTGAGGFIGSHLAEQLVDLGANVRCLVRYNSRSSSGWLDDSRHEAEFEIVRGDVRDYESVVRASRDVDVIFHLAALIGIPYSYESPRSYLHTNIEGTLNVLEAARQLETERVVCTSTSEVYGSARYVPIDEKHPLQGQSPYSATKIGADKIAESYYLSFGLPVSIARPFNTYGPRQSARAVIPTIITQALAGLPVKLGNLLATRDFNFVTDTAGGFLALAESPNTIGKVLNFGSGVEISIRDLADTIFELIGKKCPVQVEDQRLRPEGSEVERLLASSDLATSLTGWRPSTPLRDGLAKTIAWMEQHLELYGIGAYTV